MFQKGLVGCQLGLGLAQIQDTALSEPGRFHQPGFKRTPKFQALDDQRQLALITAHLAAPAPVAAGLFAGDLVFLAQRHRYAAFGKEVGGGGPNDAAAYHDGIDMIGQSRRARDGIGDRVQNVQLN